MMRLSNFPAFLCLGQLPVFHFFTASVRVYTPATAPAFVESS